MDVHDLLVSHIGHNPTPVGFDFVFVRDVQILANVGPDAWGRSKPQPLIISATIPFSIEQAGLSDKIEHALDYRTVYKVLRSFDSLDSDANAPQYGTPMKLAAEIIRKLGIKEWARLDIVAPKALLHAEGVSMRYYGWVTTSRVSLPPSTLSVKALNVPCIIGIGEHERLQKQPVMVEFAVGSNSTMDDGKPSVPARLGGIFEKFEKSTFLTLEAFVTELARHLTVDLDYPHAAVSAHKPGVFGMADGPGVQIVRTKQYFETAARR